MACSQGIAPDTLRRLPTLRFNTETVIVRVDKGVEPIVYHTALQHSLEQVHASLQTEGTDIVLSLEGWLWSDMSVVQTVAAALPSLAQYRVSLKASVYIEDAFGRPVLTDELLTAVLAMGDRVHSFEVSSLSLQSDQHSNTAWPGWDELCITSLDVRQLLRLPQPVRDGPQCDLSFDKLQLPHDLTQVRRDSCSLTQGWCARGMYAFIHVVCCQAR